VQSVHVFALVHGVRRGKMPLRGVLVRTRCLTFILAAEAIYSKSKEARVLVCVLSPDCVQFYATTEVSSCMCGVDDGAYGQQRHPDLVCQRGLLSLSGRSAVWDCGRGRHRSLCRSGGARASGLVGRCSSGCLRSCFWSVCFLSCWYAALTASIGTLRPAVEASCQREQAVLPSGFQDI
jgi:hypothetical protein